jgi:hypothetical protein
MSVGRTGNRVRFLCLFKPQNLRADWRRRAFNGRQELLDAMPPYQGGGEMILTVDTK